MLFASEIVENHLLIAQACHNRLCFAAVNCERQKATDSEIARSSWCEIIQALTNHNIFDNVNFMQEIVSVRGWFHCENSVVVVSTNVYRIAHLQKCVFNFFCRQVYAELLVDCAQTCCRRLLEIERNCDFFAESCFIRVNDFYRLNLISCVRKIASHDVRRKDKAFHLATSKLNEQIFVADLNSAELCAVDNRSH